MTWWASGDAREPTGPQGQEMARRPDRRLLGKTRAGTGPAPSQNIIRAQIIIISGTGAVTGLFEYSGTPALGNPPIAYAAAPGVTHDPFGNTLPATGGGFVTVSGTQFANLLGFTLNFGGTGLTSTASVGIAASGGAISLASATTAAAPGQGTLSITPAAGLADPLALLNALLRLISGLAGNELLGLRVTGDTVDRLAINSNGQLSWGTGALAADTTLARTAAGQLTIGNTLIAGTVLTNLLELTEQAVPAATTSVQVIGNTSGHAEVVSDTTHGDSNRYDVERLTLTLSADVLISTIAGTTLWTKTIANGGTYYIEGIVKGVQGATANGQTVTFGGTATASFNTIYIQNNAVGNTSVTDSDLTGALPVTTVTPVWGAGTTFYVRFEGILTFSSAGTFVIKASAPIAADTWTAKAASIFNMYPVVAT